MACDDHSVNNSYLWRNPFAAIESRLENSRVPFELNKRENGKMMVWEATAPVTAIYGPLTSFWNWKKFPIAALLLLLFIISCLLVGLWPKPFGIV